jgi:2-polyprenyl-3-methyl-5-hydroxy-6-metoxy-1,4-benzoquinol methylase
LRSQHLFLAYWSSGFRFRRRITYAAQTKSKRFRKRMRDRGLSSHLGLRVIDQGFGMGDMLFAFDRSTTIAGLELSESAVSAAQRDARRRGFMKVDLRHGNAESRPPSEWLEYFDVGISSHVLEHVENPRRALANLASTLKPGALACIVAPINERPGEDPYHVSRFTSDALERIAVDAGFIVENTVEEDRLWHLLGPAFYRRQRSTSLLWRSVSIAQNLLFAPIPARGLALADRLLATMNVPPRQLFLWCQKQS